jgi:hypothetical protein
MPTGELVFCPTPSAAIIDAIVFRFDFELNNGFGSTTFELTTYLGYKLIRVIGTSGGDTQTRSYVFTAMASDEVIPARLALMSPGFQLQLYSNFKTGFEPGSWSTLRAWWELTAIGMLAACLDYFTNGSVGTLSYLEIASMADTLYHRVAIIPIFTDTEVLILQAGLFGLDNNGGNDFQWLSGAFIPTPGFGGGGVGFVQEIAKLTRAIQDLANTSRITWINDQGGFADIMSGDIVTGP